MASKDPQLRALGAKKALLIHNYGLFLDRQTRLFSIAHSLMPHASTEVSEKLGLSILDDLTIFAISLRRLIHLCRLQSQCNALSLRPLTVSKGDGQFILTQTTVDNRVGFLTVLNRIIHMSDFLLFADNVDLCLAYGSRNQREVAIWQSVTDHRPMHPAFRVAEEKHEPLILSLSDLVSVSETASEAIVDKCGDAKVHLEIWMNNI